MRNGDRKLEAAREFFFVIARRERQPHVSDKFKIDLQLLIHVNRIFRLDLPDCWQEMADKLAVLPFPLATDDGRDLMSHIAIVTNFLPGWSFLNFLQFFFPLPEILQLVVFLLAAVDS